MLLLWGFEPLSSSLAMPLDLGRQKASVHGQAAGLSTQSLSFGYGAHSIPGFMFLSTLIRSRFCFSQRSDHLQGCS